MWYGWHHHQEEINAEFLTFGLFLRLLVNTSSTRRCQSGRHAVCERKMKENIFTRGILPHEPKGDIAYTYTYTTPTLFDGPGC
jgi:hypothetical protein